MITISIKRNCRKLVFIILILFFIISGNVYATDELNAEIQISEEYLKWQNLSEEEKESTLMPSMYVVDMPEEIMNKQISKLKFSKIIRSHTNSIISYPVTNSIMKTYYNLNDHYDIEVRNQGIMQCCWAVATLNSMETNEQIKTGKIANYSERHMDFATSEDFLDAVNPNAFKRNVEDGGTALIGLAYLTNGQGAVLEEEMPFENDSNPILLNEVNISPTTYVTDYAYIPSIYKYYNEDGSPVYYNSYGEFYTDEEVKVIRDNIKKHIVNNGGIIAYTAGNEVDYYNSSDIINADAYYYNGDTDFDHAITIVGWDDNYSKDNFTGKAKPTKDGAYIVLNSYSNEAFDNGFLYISYEDKWIESTLYGVGNTSAIDYDNLYQHDYYGGGVPIDLYTSQGEIPGYVYYASIFEKNSDEIEKLTAVSVNSIEYCSYEIYVNANGRDVKPANLTKVFTTDVLEPGYHKINIDEVELTGDEFAIVIKQIALDGEVALLVEPQMDGTFYEYADSKEGNSLISVNGEYWQNLSILGKINYGGIIVDTTKSDVCIKAFTNFVDEEIPDEELPGEDTKPDEEQKPDEELPGEDTKPDEEQKPDGELPGEDTKPDEEQKPDEELPGEDTKPDEEQKPDEELPGEDTKPDEEQKPDEELPSEDTKPDEEQKPDELISSDKFTILEDKYITKIEVGATILDICNEINFTKMYKIYDKDNNEIKDYNTVAKTNMYIETNNQKYYLVIRTDVNGDGRMSLIDLSRALAHIYETEGYKLEGAYLLACDLSLDGNVSLIDFSQFLALYNSL